MRLGCVCCQQPGVPLPPPALAPAQPGPTLPLVQFWSEARPDWYSLYAARQQRQDEEQQRGGDAEQAAAQQAAGGWDPPTLSITSLLRRWEASRRALMEARIAKKRRREAWMLQQYGGVAPDAAEGTPLAANGCGHGGCGSCEAAAHHHHHHHHEHA